MDVLGLIPPEPEVASAHAPCTTSVALSRVEVLLTRKAAGVVVWELVARLDPLMQAVDRRADSSAVMAQGVGELEPGVGGRWGIAFEQLEPPLQAFPQSGGEALNLLAGEHSSEAPFAVLGGLR